jgi:hypothetical protein
MTVYSGSQESKVLFLFGQCPMPCLANALFGQCPRTPHVTEKDYTLVGSMTANQTAVNKLSKL